MPNYVFNEIIFYNEKLVDKIWNEELMGVDFNILIPEPETEEECINKYGDEYIDHGNLHLGHTKGKEWFNWYDWRRNYWGTKWGAWDGEMSFKGDGAIVIKFTTAWAPPYHWIKALEAQGITFVHCWRSEFDLDSTMEKYN